MCLKALFSVIHVFSPAIYFIMAYLFRFVLKSVSLLILFRDIFNTFTTWYIFILLEKNILIYKIRKFQCKLTLSPTHITLSRKNYIKKLLAANKMVTFCFKFNRLVILENCSVFIHNKY